MSLIFMRQNIHARFDLSIQQSKDSEFDMLKHYNTFRNEFSLDLFRNYKTHGLFYHYMGDYDSEYYVYMCSQVYATDMYYTKIKSWSS